MPKSKQPLSETDQLRAHAARASGARWEEAQDNVLAFEERKDAADTAADALDELGDLLEQIQTAAQSLRDLSDYHIGSEKAAELLEEASSLVEEATGLASSDDLRQFVTEYDAAAEALEEYGNVKEEDPYPGKREALEDAWNTAQGALEALADAYDTVEEVTVAPTEEV